MSESNAEGHGNRHQVEEADPATVKKAVAGAAIGNGVEWFDYAVYAYLTTQIGLNFFPEFSPTAQSIFVFAGIAIPFVLRPLGGIILGPLGDRYGRRQVLAVTIVLMAGATFLIGLLPSFTVIGLAAPILLLTFRLVQGFSTGGEYGGAATFIAEYAPYRRRGFFGSFLEFGTLAGTVLGAILATAVQLGLSEEALNSWGWRIPFLVAGPLGLVGFYLRSKLEDTPAFRAAEQDHTTTSAPFREVCRNVWPQILHLIGFVMLLNVANYTLLTYMPSYLTDTIDIDETEALFVLIGVMLIMMVIITPIGRLSDRIGRKPLLLGSAISTFVLAIPAFWLISLKSWLPVTIGIAILGLQLVMMLGVIGSALPAMFPTRNRYGGFSIGYATSTAAFGGTAPLINETLIAATGNTYVPAFYLMLSAAVAIYPLIRMPETAGIDISHPTRIPGTDHYVPEREPAMAGAPSSTPGPTPPTTGDGGSSAG
ncbi:glycine betaine/L-proline transporter ProP [Pseudonocardia halophobica]|uniref:Putative proline/betaine transporter n=1 Tax=Pseudonocardia halophobica TaxID=29401 RepID=A0A9W6P093_9PSEU|nr:MFS transporter [Pseudonocardia halophobica]GLL15469.1 MFS transporter [Pseudonocardia halophobica]